MSNLLAPVPRQRTFSDLGVVAPGSLLHTYVSGTPATPLPTYSDAAGTVPNANPIVASAGGLFGPIYLPTGVAFHFVLTDAAGLPLWDQDPVTAGTAGAMGVADGGTGNTAFTTFSLLASGTTATGPFITLPSGVAGQVLVSGGAGAYPGFSGRGLTGFVNLPNIATVPIDASQGTLFVLITSLSAVTIAAPTNSTPGQRLILYVFTNGPACTVTLTGGAGGFHFGTTIPSLTLQPAGTSEYIGCVCNAANGNWDVVGYVKGIQ